jgi:hypothetical protein
MLQEIRRNPDITIAAADKNLGPVGINTSHYIEWEMKHLSDESIYNILTEEEATEAAKTLSKKIFDWSCRFSKSLYIDTVKYIRHQLDKTKQDPFGYFYLLIDLTPRHPIEGSSPTPS